MYYNGIIRNAHIRCCEIGIHDIEVENMEIRFKDTNTGEIYDTPRIELDTIKEHKHSEDGHNYWHPADRIHDKSIKTYVCISCEKPCVMKTDTTPYGCLSHYKHKNSQWKETNIIDTIIKPVPTPEMGEILSDGVTLWINTEAECILRVNCMFALKENMEPIPITIHKTGGLLNITESKSEYIDFGDFSRKHLGLTCQQGSKYVEGVIDNYPELGQGLRFLGNNNNYHSLKIHKDDVQTFLNRFNDYMETR